MSALDNFEDAIYFCLDEGIELHELADWLGSFEEMWQDAMAEEAEIEAEEEFLSEHDAAVSQAHELLRALEEAEPACGCNYLGQCDRCAEDEVVESFKVVVTTSVEDRLNQIDSLLNRLFDEVRDLKRADKVIPGDAFPSRRPFEGVPMHPQQPYQPPQTIPVPSWPHNPLHPWSGTPLRTTCGGGNNCRCGSH